MADSQFVPDDMDDYLDEVDPDAYLQVEQEMYEEADAMEAAASQQQQAGQENPRRLDFAAYGDLAGSFSDPLQPGAHETQAATAPLSSQLRLSQEPGAAVPAPAAAGKLSLFEQERRAEEERQAEQRKHSFSQQGRTVSAFPSPNVLPPLMRSVSELRQRVLDDERIYVFRRAPAIGEFMSVTSAKGDRVFLTMGSTADASKKVAAHNRHHRTQHMHQELGQVNVRRMLHELEEESTAAALQTSMDEAKAREWDSDPEDDERTKLRKRRQRKERLIAKLDQQDQAAKLAGQNAQLWVDKYRPRGYADLLSPETINREVLEWLRGWDLCVFGAKKTAAGAGAENGNAQGNRTLDNHMLQHNLMAPQQRKKKVAVVSADGETDIRPEHKIILLCGPPGLGKTTLAHILARQAGYHPYEINASDDRNSSILESKIRAATEMQSMSFGENHVARPNCVILDEIDGVAGEIGGQDAISMLVKLVQAEPKSKKNSAAGKKEKEDAAAATGGGDDESDADEAEGGGDGAAAPSASSSRKGRTGGGKSDSKPGPLKRPIICICNDQYTASLRPLRAIARVFEFTAAPKGKFVDRLKYISKHEGMEVDSRTLGALSDIVDCDIRSALNTLQFVHSRGQKLTAGVLNNLAVGRKDVEKSRSAIWEAVFCDKETNKKKDHILNFRDMRETEEYRKSRNQQNGNTGNGTTNAATAQLTAKEAKAKELHGLLSDSGDMDKIMEGIFHNYPLIPYPDPDLYRTVECAEWMVYADLIQEKIMADVEMSFLQYTPYAALGIHHLISRPRRVMLEFPTMYYHQFLANQRNIQIVRSFLSPSNCFTLQGITQTSTVLDIIPHVLDILHPTIRAVNFQLLTNREKNDLHNLIDTMLSLAVTYRPEIQNNFGSTSSNFIPAWKQAQLASSGDGAASNVIYKMDPSIELLCKFSNPLDAATAKQWDPKGGQHSNKFGATTPAGKFGQQAQPQQQANMQQSFHIDKRDVNMPNKVKREVLRELKFEAMRRAEEARSARFADAESKGTAAGSSGTSIGATASAEEAAPSLLSPAVQKLLDAEKRKRERPSESATTTPPAAASKAGGIGGAAAAEDDPSPATKRARNGAALNFLNQHADAARNSKNRNRVRAPAAAKLDLTGLPTEGERGSKTAAAAGAASAADAVPPPHTLHPLHYKYNDGCTNAVRRTISTAHFLPL